MLKTRIIPYNLHFKRPAGTSRGVYHDHQIWYVVISDASQPERWGIGECAPLFDLSCDYNDDYEQTLRYFCQKLEQESALNTESLRPYPSILFGLETAMRQLEQGSFRLWDTPFARGEQGIPINGLIWMGDYDYMLEQIETKMQQGFRCIKLKIGSIDFDKELDLLHHIRKYYAADKITLRVDANGAFSPDNALDKLKRLTELDLHSIEQPIRAGQWEKMSELVKITPLPIALDEELIGINRLDDKKRLLETIKPQYIILKPTLHGGISGATEWIKLAESMNIGWWITSALESNVGLNAIAQWCATFNPEIPQGLGTGGLYTNNPAFPLFIKKDCLWSDLTGEIFSITDLT
ncbi:o-succinylbenzoate synthase [Prevotella sp. 10(H)]|uniref:o-succinylbenzoate synthase n=1 Tax=Prevotella sp. 10(H) TaxID=1158294 RepID=UPI0004A72E55|nr:o-succinylbenzoate synthase [Prevotella sp. 10(H)]